MKSNMPPPQKKMYPLAAMVSMVEATRTPK